MLSSNFRLGIADRHLTQPVACCIDQEKNIIFVVDTGKGGLVR